MCTSSVHRCCCRPVFMHNNNTLIKGSELVRCPCFVAEIGKQNAPPTNKTIHQTIVASIGGFAIEASMMRQKWYRMPVYEQAVVFGDWKFHVSGDSASPQFILNGGRNTDLIEIRFYYRPFHIRGSKRLL